MKFLRTQATLARPFARLFSRSLTLVPLVLLAAPAAHAEVTILDANNWKLTTNGFVETDIITDSTRSFREIMGNNPVERSDAFGKGNGNHGRTAFSMRNSRVGFGLAAPQGDAWKARGYYEFDFNGYDVAPSNSATSNTESTYYNGPTFRMRHGYVEVTNTTGWKVLAGQTWELMGWQPYYFMNTVDVSPIAAMTYNRVPQIRATKQMHLSESIGMEAAIAALRPPQADSQVPDVQAGLRWTMDNYTSGFTGSASGVRKVQPASFGISGAARSIAMPTSTGTIDRFSGGAVAFNALIPVIPSSDNKSVSGTLSLLGEFTTGTGYGDQFNGWTGNTANPLQTASNTGSGAYAVGNTAKQSVSLDGGIGDYDPTGAFHLIQLQTFNVHAQYHLPHELPFWLDAGFGQLAAGNMSTFVTSADNKGSSGKIAYNRDRTAFFNVFHQVSDNLRSGLEYVYSETRYVDDALAKNHRVQLTGLYTF